MKHIVIILFLIVSTNAVKAQAIDLKKFGLGNIDITSLLTKKLTVTQGWAPKFSFGNIDINKISAISKIVNLKNVNTATKLFNTFKTGRSVYKISEYVGMASTAYSLIKNSVESNKTAIDQAAIDAKRDAIKKAQNFAITGGITMLSGVVIKLLTKKAASKAADAFNGAVKTKLKDILSFDSPTQFNNDLVKAGIALKIKL